REGLAITLSSPDESVALKSVERMLGKSLTIEVVPGYAPPAKPERRGARKNSSDKNLKTAGAFGKKKRAPTAKKRKTTKRDGFKALSSSAQKHNKKGERRGGK
ncbi:MAG: ATP-dependent helicase, partial [Campylobacterota bacterium]|nr:ATP-dependent helicase [Campylobacterota bacterium]